LTASLFFPLASLATHGYTSGWQTARVSPTLIAKRGSVVDVGGELVS
jgi:hypothetical protein